MNLLKLGLNSLTFYFTKNVLKALPDNIAKSVHLSLWLGLESLSCHVTKWFGIKPFPCQLELYERELSVTVLFEEWGGGWWEVVVRIAFSRMLSSIHFPLDREPLLHYRQQPFNFIVLAVWTSEEPHANNTNNSISTNSTASTTTTTS